MHESVLTTKQTPMLETGDFKPDRYGDMKFRRDFPLKKDALQEHPGDLGHEGSYFFGGKPLTTKFRPNFHQPEIT